MPAAAAAAAAAAPAAEAEGGCPAAAAPNASLLGRAAGGSGGRAVPVSADTQGNECHGSVNNKFAGGKSWFANVWTELVGIAAVS
jgi:hypothetical protein